MSLMALLNTVYTYGVAICGVTSVTSKNNINKLTEARTGIPQTEDVLEHW